MLWRDIIDFIHHRYLHEQCLRPGEPVPAYCFQREGHSRLLCWHGFLHVFYRICHRISSDWQNNLESWLLKPDSNWACVNGDFYRSNRLPDGDWKQQCHSNARPPLESSSRRGISFDQYNLLLDGCKQVCWSDIVCSWNAWSNERYRYCLWIDGWLSCLRDYGL